MSTNTKNLFQRIAAVMEEVKYVQKTGYNGFHKYKYAKEADYIESLRPAMLKHGIVVIPFTSSTVKSETITTVEVQYTIVNIDNPSEKITVSMPGQGEDKGDKGVYKALTGSKKYFLSTLFLIETGDDAEADEETDKRAAPAPKAAAAPVAAAPAAKTVADARPTSFRRPGKPVVTPEMNTDSDLGDL